MVNVFLVNGAWSEFSKHSSNLCLNDNNLKDVNFNFQLNPPFGCTKQLCLLQMPMNLLCKLNSGYHN